MDRRCWSPRLTPAAFRSARVKPASTGSAWLTPAAFQMSRAEARTVQLPAAFKPARLMSAAFGSVTLTSAYLGSVRRSSAFDLPGHRPYHSDRRDECPRLGIGRAEARSCHVARLKLAAFTSVVLNPRIFQIGRATTPAAFDQQGDGLHLSERRATVRILRSAGLEPAESGAARLATATFPTAVPQHAIDRSAG